MPAEHAHDCRHCRRVLQLDELQPYGDWHLCDGPGQKSPLWRFGAWLIGFGVVLLTLAATSIVTGIGSLNWVMSAVVWYPIVLGFFVTAPHALARRLGKPMYRAPRDSLKVRPEEWSTVLWSMLFWRSFLSIGDGVATWVWNRVLPLLRPAAERLFPFMRPADNDPTDAFRYHS